MTEKVCKTCGKKVESEAAALCEKVFMLKDCYCLECLSKELKVPREFIDGIIQGYKNRGCPAFV